MRVLPLGLTALLMAASCLSGGCQDRSPPTPGERAVGEACGGDRECETGLCVGGVAGEDPVCTKSCMNAGDCPQGWSCSGVTSMNLLVCKQGASTPFGH